MSREFIPRLPLLQPSRAGEGPTARDFTELSKQVSELSNQLSAEARPHLSSRFIDTEAGSSTTIDLKLAGPNGVAHGLGRKYRGWTLAGIFGAAFVYEATDAEIDTYNIDKKTYLPLWTTADVTVKLIIW